MVTRPVLILCVLVFGNALYQAESVLKITFIEDLCYNSKSSELDLRYDTSGILMAAPRGEVVDCEVVLNPPKGAHVVISIFRYDLHKDDILIIEDSDRHRLALMGYGVFRDEKKSVISEGKTRILYKTGNETHSIGQRAGFQFTFTKVMKSPCSSNEFKCANSYCVLKNYMCDGHNHCGDNSDQQKCDSIRKEPKVDPGIGEAQKDSHLPMVTWLTLITIATIAVGAIIVVTIIVLLVRRSKQKKAKTGQIITQANGNPEAGASSPQPAPPETSGTQLQSVSAPVPQQQDAQHAADHGTKDTSFYNRVRRSLRGQPRVENVPKEQSPAAPEPLYPRVENIQMELKKVPESHHHVPSMYPSLDQIPSAPEMFGVDNPEFEIEE